MKKKNVLLAMSGGIDSSVAAHLLIKDGYQVTGIYFSLVEEEDRVKSEEKNNPQYYTGGKRAQLIAKKLNIPLYEIDYRKEFEKIVIQDFIRKYYNGITPNPCILCNERIKFKLLEFYADKMNIQFLATGHYVRVQQGHTQNEFVLKRGVDKGKDQSYFLYRLNKNIFYRCIFPLGNLKKDMVKSIAAEIGIDITNIKESQEICFIPGNNYRKFIKNKNNRKTNNKPGYFIDDKGNVLGKHKGIAFYTIGQRRKIGLSLNSRKYITSIDPDKNTIVIGDEPDLYKNKLKLEDVHIISNIQKSCPLYLQVQIRYNSAAFWAKIFPDEEDNSNATVIFDEPIRAITAGQSAVFYDNENVIGGGIISN
ncbi:MAG: tRNA 2-thiouridine(34) synthase MnmA [Candidatus Caldatribacteriota bacterium]